MSEVTVVPDNDVWKLKITRLQFLEIYKGKVDPSIFERDPVDDEDFTMNFLTSKLWRLNNLYTITDKDANEIIFNMNYAQHRVYAASLEHARLIILKSRQQGISTFWLVSFFDDTMTIPNLKSGLMAQGDAEASTLLERVKLALNKMNPALKAFFEIKLAKDNTSELAFSNNATLFIRNSFRSTTLQRLHISEFGKIANANPKRAQETKTGTLQSIRPGNTVVIESTAEGDNEFKLMWDKAVIAEQKATKTGLGYAGKAFKPIFLSWLDDPDCVSDMDESPNAKQAEYFQKLEDLLGIVISQQQKNFWIDQYSELGDAIYQEYPATPEEAFLRSNDGSYYGPAFKKLVVKRNRIVKGLYDPNLEVYVAMDLGIDDYFTLLYFQRWKGEWRLIDEYYNNGEGLEFYVEQIKATGYPIKAIICPHDIMVQELGTAKTRISVLRGLTSTPCLVLPKLGVAAGIEQVRRALPTLWVDEKCEYHIGCFNNYSKELDEKRRVWKNVPLHDKWSHGADTIRYMATSNAAQYVNRVESKARRNRDHGGIVDGLAF